MTILPKILKRHTEKISAVAMMLGIAYSLSAWSIAVVALAAGVAIAITCGNPYQEWTKLHTSRLLALCVAGLGGGVDLTVIGRAGMQGFWLTFFSIAATLLLGLTLGRALKTDRDTSILISVGTAICGGSAIAAVAPALKAKSQSVAVALGTVFILNAIALLIFPFMGHIAGLTQAQFGLWSALAIHDTSSVVGAGMQYGPEALQVGTTVKLVRALWILPVTLLFAFLLRKETEGGVSKVKKPWFILGFFAFAALVTLVPQLQAAGQAIEAVARRGLVLTLFLIGANLSRETLKAVGIRPMAQGLCLWLIVAASTLALVRLF